MDILGSSLPRLHIQLNIFAFTLHPSTLYYYKLSNTPKLGLVLHFVLSIMVVLLNTFIIQI